MGKTSLFGSNHLLFSVAQAPSTHLVRPSGLCPYSQLVPSHLTDLVVIHDEDKYSRFNEIDVHAYGFASQAIGNQNSREVQHDGQHISNPAKALIRNRQLFFPESSI